MTRTVLALLALALGGCVTAKPIPLPDGSRGYVVDECDSLAVCYRKAAETCGGKYELISEASGSVGNVSGSPAVIGFVIPTYSVTFRCPATQQNADN